MAISDAAGTCAHRTREEVKDMTNKEKLKTIQEIMDKAWEIMDLRSNPAAALGVLSSIEAIITSGEAEG